MLKLFDRYDTTELSRLGFRYSESYLVKVKSGALPVTDKFRQRMGHNLMMAFSLTADQINDLLEELEEIPA